MQEEKYYGDGVITGHGMIHGRKVLADSNLAKQLDVLFIVTASRIRVWGQRVHRVGGQQAE